MRILYGVQGTGKGHLTRALALIPLLRSKGVNVDVIVSGNPVISSDDYLKCIEPYTAYHGLSFECTNGWVNYFLSIKNLRPFRLFKDYSEIKERHYDLVITDYEPITAWWGKNNGVLTIGIANQYSFWYDAPRPRFRDPFAELLFLKYAPVHIAIGLDWKYYSPLIAPPILRKEVYKVKPQKDGRVLIYLPGFSKRKIETIFSSKELSTYPITAYPFPSTNGIKPDNIRFKEYSATGFLEDLAKSSAVICQAGFVLLSECLYLGKPVIAIPIRGQYEQSCTVKALKKWGLAESLTRLKPKHIAALLNNLNPKIIKFPNPTERITNWIANGLIEKPEEVIESIWTK